MTDSEGGPGEDRGDLPEPIQDDRDGGGPASKGGDPSPGGASAADGQEAIDLGSVQDRAS